MKEIKQIVARISGHRNRECYTILCYAVEAARHYQPQEPKMKVILADVVDMMEEKKELSTLSKALSRVAADIWEHGDHQELWKVFGRPRRRSWCFVWLNTYGESRGHRNSRLPTGGGRVQRGLATALSPKFKSLSIMW